MKSVPPNSSKHTIILRIQSATLTFYTNNSVSPNIIKKIIPTISFFFRITFVKNMIY